MKIYNPNSHMANFIQFKNVKIALDINTGVFLNINNKENIIMTTTQVREILFKKFKILSWDSIDNDLSHIKFLIKYSPIFSKFVDMTEFDEIELITSNKYKISHWFSVPYMELNDNNKFFRINEAIYKKSTFFFKLNSKFLKIMNEMQQI